MMDASLHARLETAPTVWFCATENRVYGVGFARRVFRCAVRNRAYGVGVARLKTAPTVLVLFSACLDARL